MKTPVQKTAVIGTRSFESMWAEFAEQNTEQPIPEGAKTVADYAETFGVSRRAAESLLKRKADSGEMIETKVRRNTPTGMRVLNYYSFPGGAA